MVKLCLYPQVTVVISNAGFTCKQWGSLLIITCMKSLLFLWKISKTLNFPLELKLFNSCVRGNRTSRFASFTSFVRETQPFESAHINLILKKLNIRESWNCWRYKVYDKHSKFTTITVPSGLYLLAKLNVYFVSASTSCHRFRSGKQGSIFYTFCFAKETV